MFFFCGGCFLVFLSFPNISQLFLDFQVFLFSKNRTSGPIFSISRNVRMFVFLSVCLSVRHTFSLYITLFLPPLPKVQCPNFVNFWNPGRKVMESGGVQYENFCLFGFTIAAAKKFFTDFVCCSPRLSVLLSSLLKVQCPNF